MSWLKKHQFIFWIYDKWQWGWLGNGWNCLQLGKVRIWL